MNSVIFDLRFGFRQKYSTCHGVIYLTDKIQEQLDSGNVARGSFLHSRSWHSYKKIESLWLGGVPNNWFSSYPQNQSQYVL